MRLKQNFSLKGHNTFGMDVVADTFAEYESESDLCRNLPVLNRPLFVVGGGSNLLFMGNFHGTVLHSGVLGIETVADSDHEVLVKAGAGVPWDDFVGYCTGHGWWGVENLSAIPGEVGASAVQNIGAYGVEVSDVIETVRAVSVEDGSIREFDVSECRYGYRTSIFKNELKGKYIVTYVTYRLQKAGSPKLEYGNLKQILGGQICVTPEDVRNSVCGIRASKLPDPAVLGNAGSFFVNPVVDGKKYAELVRLYPDMPSYKAGEHLYKIPAGWLIERCGWKGKSMGKASVYERQSLVIVNNGGATGPEIKALADSVINSVSERFGIILETEVNYI